MRCFIRIHDGVAIVEEFEGEIIYSPNHNLQVKPDKAGTRHYWGYISNINKDTIIFVGSMGTGVPSVEIFCAPICEATKKLPK